MKKCDPLDDYEKYIQNMSMEELNRIENSIDRYKYPDRHELVKKRIDYMQTRQTNEIHVIEDNKPQGIMFIYYMHIVLIVIIAINILATLLKINIEPILMLIHVIFMGLFSTCIVYGIYRRKDWVIMLALVHGYYALFTIIVNGLRGSDNKADIVGRVIGSGIIVGIFAYQIYVFSRSDTKIYFKHSDEAII